MTAAPVYSVGEVDATGGEVDVTVVDTNGVGWLSAWMDFNSDGDFLDSGELIINQAASAGTSNIEFAIPIGTDLVERDFYSRFRLLAKKAFDL